MSEGPRRRPETSHVDLPYGVGEDRLIILDELPTFTLNAPWPEGTKMLLVDALSNDILGNVVIKRWDPAAGHETGPHRGEL